ncbi:hypothetical protein DSECCO2_562960 [anaerobic digester metagenome]
MVMTTMLPMTSVTSAVSNVRTPPSSRDATIAYPAEKCRNWATSAAALSPGRPKARRSGSNAAAMPSMTPVAERRENATSAARVMGTTRRSVGTAFLHPEMTTS